MSEPILEKVSEGEFPSLITLPGVPDDDVFVDIRTDPRVQWFKDRILTFIGTEDEDLFFNMVEEADTREKFSRFLSAPLQPNELLLDKRCFYVSKIIVDKLIHEEKEFTEWRKYYY